MEDGSKLHVMAETMRLAFRDRALHLGDADFVEVPVEFLLSDEHARSQRSHIDVHRAGNSFALAGDVAVEKAEIMDEDAEKAGDLLVGVLTAVRKHKSEKQVSLKTPVKLTIDAKPEDKKLLETVLDDLKAAANAEISFGKAKTECPECDIKVDVVLNS